MLVLSIFGLHHFFHGGYIAYCNAAYIRAHIIEIASRVDGHLISVLVKNNQQVEKGELLLRVDPAPVRRMNWALL